MLGAAARAGVIAGGVLLVVLAAYGAAAFIDDISGSTTSAVERTGAPVSDAGNQRAVSQEDNWQEMVEACEEHMQQMTTATEEMTSRMMDGMEHGRMMDR